jgi:hypothetical protein
LNQLAIYYLWFERCWAVKVVVAAGFCGDEGWGLEWLSGN